VKDQTSEAHFLRINGCKIYWFPFLRTQSHARRLLEIPHFLNTGANERLVFLACLNLFLVTSFIVGYSFCEEPPNKTVENSNYDTFVVAQNYSLIKKHKGCNSTHIWEHIYRENLHFSGCNPIHTTRYRLLKFQSMSYEDLILQIICLLVILVLFDSFNGCVGSGGAGVDSLRGQNNP